MHEISSNQIYREHILDLYRNPHNFGSLKNPTKKSNLNNPLCGDEITINLIIKNNKIKEARFTAEGCAISIASASLLTDKIKGMQVNYVKKFTFEDIQNLLQISLNPARLKCALLPLEAIKKSIEK